MSARGGRGAGPGRAGRAAVPGRVPGPPGRARRRGRARPHRGGEGLGGRRAADHLRALEATDFCLSAGGDMVCRTLDSDAPPWRIGIEDPHHTDRLVAVAPVHTGAVATSGTAHRGDHLVDART
ncbi:MAG TPA: FAD:protein FMN transferase, partial [Actinomycetota bacterium]|nr:FAD:protein FMN transferase [Actinomycetota bacterium]